MVGNLDTIKQKKYQMFQKNLDQSEIQKSIGVMP